MVMEWGEGRGGVGCSAYVGVRKRKGEERDGNAEERSSVKKKEFIC